MPFHEHCVASTRRDASPQHRETGCGAWWLSVQLYDRDPSTGSRSHFLLTQAVRRPRDSPGEQDCASFSAGTLIPQKYAQTAETHIILLLTPKGSQLPVPALAHQQKHLLWLSVCKIVGRHIFSHAINGTQNTIPVKGRLVVHDGITSYTPLIQQPGILTFVYL